MLAQRAAMNGTQKVYWASSGTSGLDLYSALGSPTIATHYTLIVPASVILGRQEPDLDDMSRLLPTIDATGFPSGSFGTWLIFGRVLGGGGRGLDGGDGGPATGAGAGAGGGAGYPAGTGGAAGDDGFGGAGSVSGGDDGDDTSISGTSPAGGSAGTSTFLGAADCWNAGQWGIDEFLGSTEFVNQLGYTLDLFYSFPAPIIESGGDAARSDHDVTVWVGPSARLWSGGGAGVPGYQGQSATASNIGEGGTAPGVDQAFANETGTQNFDGGESGYAIRLTGGASAQVGGNTGSDFVKGTVG